MHKEQFSKTRYINEVLYQTGFIIFFQWLVDPGGRGEERGGQVREDPGRAGRGARKDEGRGHLTKHSCQIKPRWPPKQYENNASKLSLRTLRFDWILYFNMISLYMLFKETIKTSVFNGHFRQLGDGGGCTRVRLSTPAIHICT